VLAVACSDGAAAAEPTRAVVVGLDGLDFDFIRNRSNLEFMPNLGQIARDPSTRVLTLKPTRPVLSPILWTSIVTGASPTRHDILDFFSYRDGRSLPISTVDRRMPAIWNVLSSRGISNLCLGTFISYPAEVIDGTYISDEAFTQRVLDRTAIHPERRVSSLGPRIGELLDQPGDWKPTVDAITDRQLRFNVGRVFAITQAKLEVFVELLAEDGSGFAMVYIEGTDEIGHFLSHLWPTPILPDQAELARSVADVVPAYFAMVDRWLGEIAAYCRRRGAYLIVISDHGFKWQNNRPDSLPHESEHAASWHTDQGVFLIQHSGLAAASLRSTKATVYDLFPTLIDIYRLPHARYEMGRSLLPIGQPGMTEDYSKSVRVETVGGGRSDEAELVDRLEALGYVRRGSNLNESRYYNNLGVTLDDEGDAAGAVRALQRATEIAPANPNPHYNLSMVYFSTRDWEPFIERFVRSINLGLANAPLAIARVADSLREMGQTRVLERLLSSDLKVDPEVLNPHYFALARHYYDNDPAASLAWLDRIHTPTPDCRVLFLKATCQLRLGREEQALAPLRDAGCERELEMLTR
jgi:predicted AlkP superfamily phosphohydrolase/phosphomutase